MTVASGVLEEKLPKGVDGLAERLAQAVLELGRMKSGAAEVADRRKLRELAEAAEEFSRQARELLSGGRKRPALLSLAPSVPPYPTEEELPTILAVDDDPVTLELMEELLNRQFRVVCARNAYEVPELIRLHAPEAVVSDLSMPGMDGLRLLELLQQDEATSRTPVLLLSGSDEVALKVRSFERGAFDYVTKPVVADELVARLRNAIARSRVLKQERQLQETDDLTGLANRRALRLFLANTVPSAVKMGEPLSLALLDQDGLKQINDQFGHPAGDQCIRAVAQALQRCKRVSDCAARLGGDEFALVMPRTSREGALQLLSRVQQALREAPVQVGAIFQEVNASMGLATLGERGGEEDWESLLNRADQALYASKRARKSRLRTSIAH